ncbi:hypothetical protein [Solidesulfovibrio sp.]
MARAYAVGPARYKSLPRQCGLSRMGTGFCTACGLACRQQDERDFVNILKLKRKTIFREFPALLARLLLFKKYPSSAMNIFQKGFPGGSRKAFFLFAADSVSELVKRVLFQRVEILSASGPFPAGGIPPGGTALAALLWRYKILHPVGRAQGPAACFPARPKPDPGSFFAGGRKSGRLALYNQAGGLTYDLEGIPERGC